MVRVMSLIIIAAVSVPGFSFEVWALTEMKIWFCNRLSITSLS